MSLASAAAIATQPDCSGLESPPRICATCGVPCPPTYNVCPQDGTPLVQGEADDPMVGTILNGTYRIRRVLATGGMGRLYAAEHVRLDRAVAVKVLHQMYADRRDSITRFEREARATGRIRSPYVVDVVDVLAALDGRPCLVTELLEGEDLQLRLDRDGSLRIPLAIRIARQMCRGLAAAHAVGVIHRDLKPSNVFLGRGMGDEPHVKILDFGVAKLADAPELTRTGALVGTPAYMAPEQARGSASVDVRADVYGVGAVLYRMVTGRPPYLHASRRATIERVLTEDPRRPRSVAPEIPDALDQLIQRAMVRDPNLRLPTMAALDAELALLDRSSLPTLRRPSIEEPKPQRSARARPWSVVVAAAVLLTSASVVAALLTSLARIEGEDLASSRWLISIGTLAGTSGIAYWLIKSLARRWQSAPALLALSRPLFSGVVTGLSVFGGADLAREVVSLYAFDIWPRPLWLLVALLVALLAAFAVGWYHRQRRANRSGSWKDG